MDSLSILHVALVSLEQHKETETPTHCLESLYMVLLFSSQGEQGCSVQCSTKETTSTVHVGN